MVCNAVLPQIIGYLLVSVPIWNFGVKVALVHKMAARTVPRDS